MKKAFKILFYIISAAFFCLYIIYRVRTIPMNTDGACMMLYADDILNGNIFLSGWSLTGLTFLTTDLPFYIIGVAIFGVSINAFHTAVTLMYIFMALCAMLLAISGVKKHYLSIAVMAATGLIPTTYALSNAFVHTAVFALAFLSAYFALKYAEQERPLWFILLGIVTAFSVSGDNMALVLITLPLLVLCMLKVFSRGLPIAVSTLAGTVMGIVIQKTFLFIGGADLNSLPHQEFIDISDFWYNIKTYFDYFLRLTNSYFFTKKIFSVKTAVFGIKVIIVLFAIYIVWSSVKAAVLRKETDIPTAQFGISLAVITLILWLTTLNANLTAGRYIAFVPLMLGIAISRCMDFTPIAQCRKKTTAVIILMVLLAAANLVPSGSGTSPFNTYSETAAFLSENGLKNGYAAFWDSYVINGYSENDVKVRAVVYTNEGNLVPHIWFCKKAWYDDPADFIIVRKNGYADEEALHNYNGIFNMRFDGGMGYGITADNIIKHLGKPLDILTFKNYEIFLYNHITLVR